MEKILFEKYLNNNCNAEELNQVLNWFKDLDGSIDSKKLFYEKWEELKGSDLKKVDIDADFDSLLNKIHHQVNLFQSKQLMENGESNLLKYSRKQYLIKILRNSAAILFFPILGFGLFMTVKYQSNRNNQISVNEAYNEVSSSIDAITKVILPDGSNVWLNHNSSLRYPAVFRGKFREVELKGEGYFEVAEDKNQPFIVNADEIQVLARGTTFNVMAYPDEDKIETSLISGIVDLRKSLPEGKTTKLCEMNPTDHTIYFKENDRIFTKTISDDRYFSWKEGKLVFNKEPMSEVVTKLSRWFNVEIQVKDPKLLDLTYTATFVNETLFQVMELISLATPINYSVSSRIEISPGVYSKRSVILKCRK